MQSDIKKMISDLREQIVNKYRLEREKWVCKI